jgi:hypothetical protein
MTNPPVLDEHTRTHNTLFNNVNFKEELCLKRKFMRVYELLYEKGFLCLVFINADASKEQQRVVNACLQSRPLDLHVVDLLSVEIECLRISL